MQPYLPAPFACAVCGSFAGLLAGGFNQCFPLWIGAATGGGVGCLICLLQALMPPKNLPIAETVSLDPVIIQNIYVTYEVSGQAKN